DAVCSGEARSPDAFVQCLVCLRERALDPLISSVAGGISHVATLPSTGVRVPRLRGRAGSRALVSSRWPAHRHQTHAPRTVGGNRSQEGKRMPLAQREGAHCQSLHPVPFREPGDHERPAAREDGFQRFHELQAYTRRHTARSVVVSPDLLLVSRNWPERLKRSTSRKTSDQLAPDTLTINSSRVESGFALTASRIRSPRSPCCSIRSSLALL